MKPMLTFPALHPVGRPILLPDSAARRSQARWPDGVARAAWVDDGARSDIVPWYLREFEIQFWLSGAEAPTVRRAPSRTSKTQREAP